MNLGLPSLADFQTSNPLCSRSALYYHHHPQWFALGSAAFLPAGCIQSKSTKFSFFEDAGTETAQARNLILHVGNETAHPRDQHLCCCMVAQLQALTLRKKLELGHQKSKVRLKLYLKQRLREFVSLDKLGLTTLHTLVCDAGKPEHI